MDGRISGAVPAALQGQGGWAATGGWVAAQVSDAPEDRVWQALGAGALSDTVSPLVNVTAGMVLRAEAWLRATVPGTGTGAVGLQLTIKSASGILSYPSLKTLGAGSVPSSWIRLGGFYTVQSGTVTVQLRAAVRPEVKDGVYQVCGARMWIVNGMPH